MTSNKLENLLHLVGWFSWKKIHVNYLAAQVAGDFLTIWRTVSLANNDCCLELAFPWAISNACMACKTWHMNPRNCGRMSSEEITKGRDVRGFYKYIFEFLTKFWQHDDCPWCSVKFNIYVFPHIDRGFSDEICERSVYDTGGSWVILLGSIPPALQQRGLAPRSLVVTLTLAGSDDWCALMWNNSRLIPLPPFSPFSRRVISFTVSEPDNIFSSRHYHRWV